MEKEQSTKTEEKTNNKTEGSEKSKNGDIDKDTLREGLKNIFAAKNEKMLGIFDDSQLEIIKIHKALSLRMKKHKGKKGGKRGGSKRG